MGLEPALSRQARSGQCCGLVTRPWIDHVTWWFCEFDAEVYREMLVFRSSEAHLQIVRPGAQNVARAFHFGHNWAVCRESDDVARRGTAAARPVGGGKVTPDPIPRVTDRRSWWTTGQLAVLLNVPPAVLRTWDHRHGLGTAPSDGVQRLYGPRELQRLRRMTALVNQGMRAGEAARWVPADEVTVAAARRQVDRAASPLAAGAQRRAARSPGARGVPGEMFPAEVVIRTAVRLEPVLGLLWSMTPWDVWSTRSRQPCERCSCIHVG